YELQYMGSGCKDNIRINKDEFLLGSCKEGNDCVIDSPVVSRYHAKIIREGKEVFLQDLNSTNGTSVNGTLLGYQDKVRLNMNDEIMFADERYKFV
nr:FHA domain-containing protein [Lachnospiraceae bacterium]